MKFVISNFIRRPLPAAACFFSAALLAGIFAVRAPELPSPPTTYSVGDVATENILTTKKVAVIDPIETAARRQREAAKVPAIFRADESVAEGAMSKFSTEFVFSREKFLNSVENTFKKRVISAQQADGTRFRKLVTKFRADDNLFPADLAQAKHWATGEIENDVQRELMEKLRETVTRQIRDDSFPPAAQTYQVRVYSAKNSAAPTLESLKSQSQLLRRTNIISLAKARNQLLNNFPREKRPLGKALTNFVAANCFFDDSLTQRARHDKTKAIWVVSPYEPGDVIVRRGEVIDAKIKAALDQLKISPPHVRARWNPSKILLWSLSGLAALTATIIILLDFRSRPRWEIARAGNVVPLPNAQTELEARLMPHLARGLMNKLVRALISQRSHLMKSQQTGSEQLNQIEEQLEQINSRLHVRQTAYEKRIAELERELAAAEEENRELIREKIREARENLERTRRAQG